MPDSTLMMSDDARRSLFADMMRHVPVDAEARADLWRRMSDPARVYHGLDHLAVLWTRHREHCAGTGLEMERATRLVACAIAYHDAVYVPGLSDNEERSAVLWLDRSARAGIDPDDRHWVADTIRATADHLAGDACGLQPAPSCWRARARLWVLDLDLTPLGEPPEVFDANVASLRGEARHIPEGVWRAGIRAFLQRMSTAPRIYRSPAIGRRFEAQARVNLARSLASW